MAEMKKSFSLLVYTLSSPHDRSFSTSFMEFFNSWNCIFLTVSVLA